MNKGWHHVAAGPQSVCAGAARAVGPSSGKKKNLAVIESKKHLKSLLLLKNIVSFIRQIISEL